MKRPLEPAFGFSHGYNVLIQAPASVDWYPSMNSERTQTATQDVGSTGAAPTPGLVIVFHPRRRFLGATRLLGAGKHLLLGRDEDTFVPDALADNRISRRHAEVRCRGRRLTIEDLGSRNGTFVNGARITSSPLSPGDVVSIGKLLLLVTELGDQPTLGDHPRIVGNSVALAEAAALVERVADRDVAVLILGESGVGKELFAREVHRVSGRRGQIVLVNCATLADGVVQSELFGHVRGAYSGAENSRQGLVTAARGGTLVLDEIGNASPALQANLLRLLQEKEVRPVGSDRTSEVDIRFVAVTNSPLVEEVRAGRFREDLYARLNRCVIRIPPLRDRPEDVLPLASHFASQFAEGRLVSLTQPLALALLRHDWPGNVRSLQSIVERLVIEVGDGDELPVPAWLDEELSQHARQQPDFEPPTPILRRRVQLTTDELRQLLERHGGNITTAAEELEVARNTLYRWVKKASIDLERMRR